MTDRRTLLTQASLTAFAAGLAGSASGCSKPVQIGAGDLTARIARESVPVGGGIVLREARFVVTQPEPGVYRAFDRTCSHADCPVKKVVDGTIECTCHGSKFAITDGRPLSGPATQPLTPRTVTVEGGDLALSP